MGSLHGHGCLAHLGDMMNYRRVPASGEWSFTVKAKSNDPVIIIPGIMGSEQKDGVWVIDPILHTYDNLIDTFKANGYTEGVDLFTFPYQWRDSNVDTAILLKDKIDEVKVICNCGKVGLVAHSMGGLVARQYIQSNYYAHDVDQLIFLGTPHLGAPNAYLTWEGGALAPGSITDKALSFILNLEAIKKGYLSLFDYATKRPILSVQELLPVYDYLKEFESNTLRKYPDNYPRNEFLEQLTGGVDSLLNSGVKITNIIGSFGSTIIGFRVTASTTAPLPFLGKWAHGYPNNFGNIFGDRGIDYGVGDGTVPEFSGAFITEDLNQVAAEHSKLPMIAESLVYSKLQNVEPQVLITDQSKLDIKNLLFIKILSPADIVIIAPDGKRVGKDFTTGQEVNEIDGSFYSGFATDDEYITIPNPLDGEYRVQVQGTGNGGEYTIAAGYISDSSLVSKDFQANILPDMVSELKIDINSSTPQDLAVTPTDNVPPEITILSPLAQDYQRPFVLPILIMATDTESGVYSQSLSFDGKVVSSSDVIDLFYLPLGIHIVAATATDFMGNFAVTSTPFKLTASVSSTISDIERAYSLGWINTYGIKNSLIKKLQEINEEERKDREDEGRRGEKNDNERAQRERKEEHKKEKDKHREEFKEFLQELKKQRGKHINEQAFLLIQEDINWLINN